MTSRSEGDTSTDVVDDLLVELTRDEKLRLVHGALDPEGVSTGYVPGVERLDVPPFRLVDGPLGVRAGRRPATAFPASLALAATFDPSLARRQGAALGREARAYGQHAVLGPGVNLVRVPHCGRNFEYLSEDPLLASRFAAGVVEGIQSEGVVATAKHYVANNQETDRYDVSAAVDERALRELYLPAFRAAVEAGAGSVMTAYNRVNGTHMSDHRRLLRDVLKGEWGFDGYVVSDWYGLHSTVGAATAGLDLEMPGVTMAESLAAHQDLGEGTEAFDPETFELPEEFPDGSRAGLFGEPLGEAVDDGEVPAERLDDMVRRVLEQMARVGLLDGSAEGEREPDDDALDAPEHRDLATEIAARGAVLLENDGVLPLDDGADVAVVGPNVDAPTLGGGGSAEVTPFDATSPQAGITARAAGAVTVERGVARVEEESLLDLLPVDLGREKVDADAPDPDLDAAVEAAERADVAVVFVRDAATEATDRADLRLPGEQDALVEAVAAANDRTVVVVNASGPVEVPWREEVAAVLSAWYPGQADGDAVASVLYGDVDPAGRLPVTFAPEDAYPTADPARFPGTDGEARYDEGVFVGYRHFDAADAEPTYPFGHGRSYAEFAYGDTQVVEAGEADGEAAESAGAATPAAAVAVDVENVSDRPGREVVQAYVRPPAVDGLERPIRELVGFAAVDLDAGESRTVTVALDELAFRRYDPDGGWTVDPGEYVVEVGRSSRDSRAEVTVER